MAVVTHLPHIKHAFKKKKKSYHPYVCFPQVLHNVNDSVEEKLKSLLQQYPPHEIQGSVCTLAFPPEDTVKRVVSG